MRVTGARSPRPKSARRMTCTPNSGSPLPCSASDCWRFRPSPPTRTITRRSLRPSTSLTQAIQAAEKAQGGQARAVEAGFEREDGKPQYEIKVMSGDKVMTYYIDAATGQSTKSEEQSGLADFLGVDKVDPAKLTGTQTTLAQAIGVAEQNTNGKAIEAEINEDRRRHPLRGDGAGRRRHPRGRGGRLHRRGPQDRALTRRLRHRHRYRDAGGGNGGGKIYRITRFSILSVE